MENMLLFYIYESVSESKYGYLSLYIYNEKITDY